MADKKNTQSETIENVESSKLKSFLGIILAIFSGIGIACVILFSFSALGFKMIQVSGNSMYPTYKSGQVQIFHKVKSPQRNDIIVFSPTNIWRRASIDKNSHDFYIKRIVAKSGDHLVITANHKIIVNGKTFRNMHSIYGNTVPTLNTTIPKNKYFVMGDNYTRSNDSLYTYHRLFKHYLVDKSQVYLISKGRNLINHDN